ncbi:MAG: hypothetical protein ACRD22_11785 [Terriglobia bacterium]
MSRTERVRPIFRWFDLWIGLYLDQPNRRLYVFPLPTLGIVIEWGTLKKASERIEERQMKITRDEYALAAALLEGEADAIDPEISSLKSDDVDGERLRLAIREIARQLWKKAGRND